MWPGGAHESVPSRRKGGLNPDSTSATEHRSDDRTAMSEMRHAGLRTAGESRAGASVSRGNVHVYESREDETHSEHTVQSSMRNTYRLSVCSPCDRERDVDVWCGVLCCVAAATHRDGEKL